MNGTDVAQDADRLNFMFAALRPSLPRTWVSVPAGRRGRVVYDLSDAFPVAMAEPFGDAAALRIGFRLPSGSEATPRSTETEGTSWTPVAAKASRLLDPILRPNAVTFGMPIQGDGILFAVRATAVETPDGDTLVLHAVTLHGSMNPWTALGLEPRLPPAYAPRC